MELWLIVTVMCHMASYLLPWEVSGCAFHQQYSVCFIERTGNYSQRFKTQHGGEVSISQLYFDKYKEKHSAAARRWAELSFQLTYKDIETLICK